VATGVETQYARSGAVHLGFQVLGGGDVDLLQIGTGVMVSVDSMDEESHAGRFERGLAGFCRLIRFDPRGIGLSDPLPGGGPPTWSELVDDALAVLDAAGAGRAAVLGVNHRAIDAISLAANYPDRVRALVLCNGYARLARAPDYPFGAPARVLERFLDQVVHTPIAGDSDDPDAYAYPFPMPSLADDVRFREWWGRAGQRGASPAAARALYRPLLEGDVRALLPQIRTPTLILVAPHNPVVRREHGDYLAEHIPGARLVTLPSDDLLPFGPQTAELVLAEIAELLTGNRSRAAERVLTTVVFTDVVASTREAARVGDSAWHATLDSHDAAVREQLTRFGGREVNTTGDGFLASFDSPASAVQCARAIIAEARRAGVEVRVGIHTGECERRGNDLAGLAVHIAARVADNAEPGEVLVSRTVRDLVVGSDLTFVDRGEHELRGVPDHWQLFALV
jgi:class 3 adenylate cyclase